MLARLPAPHPWNDSHHAQRPVRPRARRRGARVPPPRAAGRPRPPRLQLPLVLDARTAPELFRVDRPRPLGARAPRTPCGCCRRPTPSACRAPPPTTTLLAPRRGARGARSTPTSRRPAATRPATPERPIAYFCAEYGVHGSLPIYSGGLGALAGDILKEASDRALPLVAVGLMYRNGYFRQRIDAGGWQHEYWVDTDPGPAARRARHRRRRRADHGHRADRATIEVVAQIWRVDVGRVPLYLLDADRPENDRDRRAGSPRACTSATRTRASRSTCCSASAACGRWRRWGSSPGIVHLNEGHAAFVSLELARREYERRRLARRRRWRPRAARTVFTTHTPVPAGNDTYPAEQVADALARHRRRRSASTPSEIVRLGRTHPDEAAEPFGVTQFALRTSRAANGVSRRHGEVAREMWQRHVARPRRRRRPDHLRDQRRAHADLARPADARAARPPPRRGLAGPRRPTPRRGRRSTTSPTRSCGPSAREQRADADRVRPRPRASSTGSRRDEPRDYAEAAAQRSTRTC